MLEDIKTNVERLISLYEKEKQRADALAGQLAQSEETVRSYQAQITELNGQIDNLKLSFAFSGAGDTVLAKERIDKLVREIDKCIKLLEKES
jgi:ferritin-like metal-binding protein YciE